MSTVNLSKGGTINLSKTAPNGLTKITLGVGWDVAKKGGFLGFGGGSDNVDLDASAILFGSSGQVVDKVYFRHLATADRSVVHTGDNLTGDGDGDDEQIKIDLQKLPSTVEHVVFTVSSFRGQPFTQIENAFCRVVDDSSGKELVKTNLSGQGSHTSIILAKLSRNQAGEFSFKSLLATTQGKTVDDLVSSSSQLLA